MNIFQIRTKLLFAIVEIVAATVCVGGETNYWVGAASGNWEDTNAWSLGILPDSSQSVWITNAGENTVSITSETSRSSPEALNLHDLMVTGSNTLFLDHLGTNLPVRVVNDTPKQGLYGGVALGLSPGATLINLDSRLVLQGTAASLTSDGRIIQSGGSIELLDRASIGGSCCISNGLFQGGYFELEGDTTTFNQLGGEVTFGDLRLDGAAYYLRGGNMKVHSVSLSVYGSGGSFDQEGGTNSISFTLNLSSGTPQSSASTSYALAGGFLAADGISVGKAGTFAQGDAIVIVTNAVTISGDVNGHGIAPYEVPALYAISGGDLSARSLVLRNYAGGTRFHQSGGSTSISELVQFAGSQYPYTFIGKFHLSGGVFTCSGLTNSDGGAIDIDQEGGAFVITNFFQFAGFAGKYDYYSIQKPPRFARYDFTGGTLFASNIELLADWFIGDSSDTGRITNPGYFKMAGLLTISNDIERLGRFILASNAVINLVGTNTSLSFADSSAEDWNSNALLLVTNWNGSLSGSGPTQLKFGTNQFGLTSAQLSGIRFRMDDPPGLYSAKILNTGEVVPDVPILWAVRVSEEKQKLILDWVPGWILQTATNIAGPFEDVPDAIPPFTNYMTAEPERFFRLR